MKKVIVIGGGAGGLMAAIEAGRTGAQVTILEKANRVGKKLLKPETDAAIFRMKTYLRRVITARSSLHRCLVLSPAANCALFTKASALLR